jgi:POT family proton-dependent oligopeptide transporter
MLALATLLERWAWSGYRSALVFHLAYYWNTESANETNYWVAMLVYLLPVLFGFRVNSFRREKNAVYSGVLLFAGAYFILSLTAELPGMLVGLAALVLGRALTINSLPALVAKLKTHPEKQPELDIWMTRLYMFANAGSFGGAMVSGLLHGNDEGDCRLAFFASGLASLACWVVVHLLFRRWVPAPGTPVVTTSISPSEARGAYSVSTTLIITVFSVVFWSGFEQKSGPINTFTKSRVDRHVGVGEWEWPTEWFQAINPLFVILLVPVFDYLWRTLDSRRGIPISPFSKMAAGLVCLGLGFGVISVAQHGAGQSLVPWAALVLVYFLHTVGELLLEPIGQSLVLRLSPPGLQTFFLALWNLSTSLASGLALIYPWLCGASAENGYAPLWSSLAVIGVVSGALLYAVSGLLTAQCRQWIFPAPVPAS